MAKNTEIVVNVNEVSRIAEGVIVKGDISSPTDIRVDGLVEGKVFSFGRVVVGEKAVMKGALLCNDTDFCGKMEGDVYARDLLDLKSTAVINGGVHARRLQVELGAQINGTCKMINEAEFDKTSEELVDAKLAKPSPSEKKSRENSLAAIIRKERESKREMPPMAN